MMPNDPSDPPHGTRLHEDHDHARRSALGCLAAWTGVAIVWTVAGGIPRAAIAGTRSAPTDHALRFVQISDTHIGFRKEANPDDPLVLGQQAAAVVSDLDAGELAGFAARLGAPEP